MALLPCILSFLTTCTADLASKHIHFRTDSLILFALLVSLTYRPLANIVLVRSFYRILYQSIFTPVVCDCVDDYVICSERMEDG